MDWGDAGVFASVSRGEASLFLCQGAPEALFVEISRQGAKVRHPPTNDPWALELQVEDLDGNVICFGSDPKEGRPPGPWLDRHGRVWPPRGT